MTDHPSSDRDELVAAYLDGEATPAERAQVEADPELLERAEILARIATMVSEPVAPPPREVRQAHIAAALEASSTAPNVTSLATKRRRFNYTQVAAIAAVVIALFAIPIALSGGDDDDDTVASFETAATDDAASGDDGSADDGGGDGDSTVAQEATTGDAVLDEGAEAAAEIEAEPEPEPLAEADDMAELEAGQPPLLRDADRFDVDPAPDLDALRLDIGEELDRSDPPQAGGDDGASDDGSGDDDSGDAEEGADADTEQEELPCVQEWLEVARSPIAVDEILLSGTTLVAGEPVEYVVVTDGVERFLVVFDENCTQRTAEFVN